MTLEPDRDQLEIFLDAVLRYRGDEGYLSLRVFQHDNKPIFSHLWTARLGPRTGSRHALDIAVDLARRAANTPEPAVFCSPIAVFNNADGFRASEADLFKGLAISVECDQHPEEARQKLQEILGEATVAARSGGQWVNGDGAPENKLHLHWRLRTPATGADLVKLKQARRIATALVGGDASNVPAVHCLRWPGSWHRKAEPRLCELISCNLDVEVDLDEALAALEQAAPGRKKTGNGRTDEAADEAELIANILHQSARQHQPTSRQEDARRSSQGPKPGDRLAAGPHGAVEGEA
jgi:exonuclease VII small subunit